MVGGGITVGPVDGHIMILLNGVKGTSMQSFSQLTDEEIAGVVTYERNAWGNDDVSVHGDQAGGLVTPSQVKSLRKEK